ncbi:PREDICTED: uncharacterized protein LOC105112325 [Populus euphratica]|uniref:Uncharacterized protein LOC105112325 n=1 Tax=Populus euphratica TaxID=75702 RepID=A0AAJ6T8M2_POPEU|nr:PREDICTED: uncharacterized protein LOC105112325 [Populus euphratica]
MDKRIIINDIVGLQNLSQRAVVAMRRNDKKSIHLPPVRGRIKPKIFSLVYKKLKLAGHNASTLSSDQDLQPELAMPLSFPLSWNYHNSSLSIRELVKKHDIFMNKEFRETPGKGKGAGSVFV